MELEGGVGVVSAISVSPSLRQRPNNLGRDESRMLLIPLPKRLPTQPVSTHIAAALIARRTQVAIELRIALCLYVAAPTGTG